LKRKWPKHENGRAPTEADAPMSSWLWVDLDQRAMALRAGVAQAITGDGCSLPLPRHVAQACFTRFAFLCPFSNHQPRMFK
jgi:hypothetical protein